MMLSVQWYFSLQNFAQQMSSRLLLVAMATVLIQLLPLAGDLLLCLLLLLMPLPSPSCSKDLLTPQANLYSICGNSCARGSLHALSVICCSGPGPMEKGKAIAFMCICTILQTWGPVRRQAQFSSKLMPWIILLSQRKLTKYSVLPLILRVSYSSTFKIISNDLLTECIQITFSEPGIILIFMWHSLNCCHTGSFLFTLFCVLLQPIFV